MINTGLVEEKIMLGKIKSHINFLSGFKRTSDRCNTSLTPSLEKGILRRKKTNTFFYSHSEIMLKMTVGIFYK